MASTLIAASPTSSGQMRPLNIMRDLPGVADLIELCFSTTLDRDGRSFIDMMRHSGHDSNFLNWAPRVIETVSLPLSGFVWEYNGRVVGNVSLIPFVSHGKKVYLIANVATHPEFRRQGIARLLTTASINRAREKHADSIWLQVRHDNDGAIQLYKDLGFEERATRTTWNVPPDFKLPPYQPGDIRILPRNDKEWESQKEWLARAYPSTLDWYHPQQWNLLQPGIFYSIYRFLLDSRTTQFSAYRHGKLQGVLSYQRFNTQPDQLWAALPETPSLDAITALFSNNPNLLKRSRNLVFEYPSGSYDDAFQSVGLIPNRTLVWMKYAGKPAT